MAWRRINFSLATITRATKMILPKILQYFDSNLLSFPCPKFREDSETLWQSWIYIESLWKKLDKCLIKKSKCEKLKKQFMELYEQAKIKEKERETEKKHPTQMPFYRIDSVSKKDDEVFRFSKKGRYLRTNFIGRKYGKIYKIQAALRANKISRMRSGWLGEKQYNPDKQDSKECPIQTFREKEGEE